MEIEKVNGIDRDRGRERGRLKKERASLSPSKSNEEE